MGTQPLVLVADDEPRITKLVSIALSEEGFRVVTATGGEDALAKAEEIRPDIVLLDIVMPDLDGIEVMRQLREQRPVPVILLTAKGATADKAKGLDLGADDYIAKPFHPDELAARVRAVIRRSTGVEPGAGVVAFDDVEITLGYVGVQPSSYPINTIFLWTGGSHEGVLQVALLRDFRAHGDYVRRLPRRRRGIPRWN